MCINMKSNEQAPDASFLCQVDSVLATKDYLRNGRCVRLLGVAPHEFTDASMSEGVTTFTIDFDFWEFCKLVLGLDHWRQITASVYDQILSREGKAEFHATWYQLDVEFVQHGNGYLYQTFSDEEPQFFNVRSFAIRQGGPVLSQIGLAQGSSNALIRATGQASITMDMLPNRESCSLDSYFVFDTFHVGQGMCSLVHNKHEGVLLDVGAGKPVTRKTYKKNVIRNDLQAAVSSLQNYWAVISHADADHWRILAWDCALLKNIRAIYFPVGARSLALKDKTIFHKVFGLGNQTWELDEGTRLSFMRSEPQLSDDNGDCLVTIFERNGSRVLAAGDYVYERFETDTNKLVNKLLTDPGYSAVVVPHHGDTASAKRVVKSRKGAKAFFSAGTHQGYNHPTTISLDAHDTAGFTNIDNHTETDIVRVNLI